MADFSIPLLLVATNGTIATANGPQDLTAGQIGVFDNTYTIANSGSIAAKPYIYIAEGRNNTIPGVGEKRSDKIAATNVLDWYKVTAQTNSSNELATFANFNFLCQQDIVFSLRVHSDYTDIGFYNGYTTEVTVTTPACACGAAPCAALTGTAIDAIVDQAIARFQANPVVSQFLTFSRVGTGATATLLVSTKPLPVYSNPYDISAYPFRYDRMWFRGFVAADPATTQDFEVNAPNNQVGTFTINQRSLFQSGSSAEIAQLEINWYSYQVPAFKALYRNLGWNAAFVSNVVPGTFYDVYWLKYWPYQEGHSFTDTVGEIESVMIAFPTGTGAAFETLMTAYIGAPADKSATNPTTTTTTSTSTTSTTTTTTLFP